jgi:hypothetical protein
MKKQAEEQRMERKRQDKLESQRKKKIALEEAEKKRREKERHYKEQVQITLLETKQRRNEIRERFKQKEEKEREENKKKLKRWARVYNDAIAKAREIERARTERFNLISSSKQDQNKSSFSNRNNKKQFTPPHTLEDAMRSSQPYSISILEELYQSSSSSSSSKNKKNSSLLHDACVQGLISHVKFLLSKKYHVNTVDIHRSGSTPLHVASRFGRVKIVSMLLEMGADVNATDDHGDTPLHVACRSGHFVAARILLKFDPDTRYKKNFKNKIPVNLVSSRKPCMIQMISSSDDSHSSFWLPSKIERSGIERSISSQIVAASRRRKRVSAIFSRLRKIRKSDCERERKQYARALGLVS